MAKSTEVVVLSREERLRDSKRQATSTSLPLAVHHRLDLLAEAAEDAHATRAEIIGMLISQADLDPEELELEILRYRKLKVGDVVPQSRLDEAEVKEPPEADNVVSIVKRGPGRPTKHESA